MKIFKFCNIFLLFSLFLTSCNYNDSPTYIRGYYFDCFCNITIYDDVSINIKEVENILSYYDNLFSPYHSSLSDENNVYDINHSKVPSKVNSELLNVITQSTYITENINNHFNILTLDLNDLYKESYSNNILPNEEDVSMMLKSILESKIVIDKDNSTIYIDGNANIDLGGVSKGYVLRILKDFFIENNIHHYSVDLGSSSVLVSKKLDDTSFKIRLKDVVPSKYFYASDISISTSSIFEQGIEVDDVRYSHIINPITGSAVSNYDLVVIKSDDSFFGDIFSTLIMMLDLNEIEILKEKYNLELLVYKDNNIVFKTDSWELMSY